VPLHLMQSNGGVTPAERARELPIALAMSGPAAGVIGGARLKDQGVSNCGMARKDSSSGRRRTRVVNDDGSILEGG
jgi:hypothetical protein